MVFNPITYEIDVTQYDYGVPIVFEAGEEQGFFVGDKIVFCFETDAISEEEHTYEVSRSDYTFEFKFSKEEADALRNGKVFSHINIPYSIKRMQGTTFLESLENVDGKSVFNLKVKGTVRYNGKTDSA